MPQRKNEYFHLGVTNQKNPDIVVDLRRVDRSKMAKWTPDQRRGIVEFLKDCESSFRAFKEEILSANDL
jgi:hypothetical protein